MSPDRQEKVLDELREREKRTNRRVLGEATKPKQRFDAESEYQVRSLRRRQVPCLPQKKVRQYLRHCREFGRVVGEPYASTEITGCVIELHRPIAGHQRVARVSAAWW